jgi:hypothetical protein
LKGERKLLKRVCDLPSDLASAYLNDLKATAEERVAFFERLAKKLFLFFTVTLSQKIMELSFEKWII